jgi:hypothetical protein
MRLDWPDTTKEALVASAVKIYVDGEHGPQVFEAASEASAYDSEMYGKVSPELLVFLDSELHVYARPEGSGQAGYEIALNAGVLEISSGGGLIRAYGTGFWQQVYRHPGSR